MPITKPDYVFLITVEEHVRQNRMRLRKDATLEDVMIKNTTNYLGRMEQAFRNFHLREISNEAHIDDVMKEIFEVLFAS